MAIALRFTSIVLLLPIVTSCRGPSVVSSSACDAGICEVECLPGTVRTEAGCQLVLFGLAVSPGALSPDFAPLQLAYDLTVPVGTATVEVTVRKPDGSRVSIDGIQIESRSVVRLRSDEQVISVRLSRPFPTLPTEQQASLIRVHRLAADASSGFDAGTPNASTLDAGSPSSERCGAGWPADAGAFPRVTQLRLTSSAPLVFALSAAGSALFVGARDWNDALGGTMLARNQIAVQLHFGRASAPRLEARPDAYLLPINTMDSAEGTWRLGVVEAQGGVGPFLIAAADQLDAPNLMAMGGSSSSEAKAPGGPPSPSPTARPSPTRPSIATARCSR